MILSEALFLLEIGFLPVSVWDILDVLIVSYLLYQLYTLVRGSIAFNIFIGVITLYALYFIVGVLGMEMLRAILGQFVSVGVIIIIIIFQPEIRRFLVLLGNTTLRQRSNVLHRLLRFGDSEKGAEMRSQGEQIELKKAILSMSKSMTGALIVISKNAATEPIGTSGTRLDAEVSDELLRTIFDKSTPLHDGAVLIESGKIVKAGCILPVTERNDMPQSVGLRHRAAVGLSERSKAIAFLVSEETGFISVAKGGKLVRRLNVSKLEEEIRAAYS
ncbi:MAG: diadenylate cyclase CdaA [Saprospiraceae bacterium]